MHVTAGTDILILSQYMLHELGRILTYPKLLKRSGLTPSDIAEYLEHLACVSTLVDPLRPPLGLMRDRADEPVLGTALAGEADVICTRDADFFEEKVRRFCATKGIRILTELELLPLFGILS